MPRVAAALAKLPRWRWQRSCLVQRSRFLALFSLIKWSIQNRQHRMNRGRRHVGIGQLAIAAQRMDTGNRPLTTGHSEE